MDTLEKTTDQTLPIAQHPLTPLLASLGLEAFSGHPEHPLNIRGVHLRREPFDEGLTACTLRIVRERRFRG